MNKIQKFTKQSTQNPNESIQKNKKRVEKENRENDNPIKKEEPKK